VTCKQAAKKLGLSEQDFNTLAIAANAVYCDIYADLEPGPKRHGLWPRRDIIEIVFDAGRVEQELLGDGLGCNLRPYMNAITIVEVLRKTEYRVLQSAMTAVFTSALY
jgi:hypothetical protein